MTARALRQRLMLEAHHKWDKSSDSMSLLQADLQAQRLRSGWAAVLAILQQSPFLRSRVERPEPGLANIQRCGGGGLGAALNTGGCTRAQQSRKRPCYGGGDEADLKTMQPANATGAGPCAVATTTSNFHGAVCSWICGFTCPWSLTVVLASLGHRRHGGMEAAANCRYRGSKSCQ